MASRDIKSLNAEEMSSWMSAAGHKPFRAKQVQDWLFGSQVLEWSAMSNVPDALRMSLSSEFRISSLSEESVQQSVDGTRKWLYRTYDGKQVETVLIPSMDRYSVCVSTQVGCAMGCAFCRTAKMGLSRNLEAGEIVEQVIRANQYLFPLTGKKVTNVIFMGMGEPLQNLDSVGRTCQILHEQRWFALGRHRMTVSTSGIAPLIPEIARRGYPCCLAVSLNGTNDEMRSRIMPINNRYPIRDLMAAVDEYIALSGESVTFEYVLIRGITCTPQAARELLKLTQQRSCKVNAILLNPGDENGLEAPGASEAEEFLSIVRAGQVQITIRTPRGRDILAACGQLATQQRKVA